MTALLLRPFLAPPAVAGAMLWALFKVALAWWIVLAALRLAGGTAGAWPPWAALLVLLLAFRPLLSDVVHGNVNLAVGATVVAAGWSWSRGRDLQAGLWAGLGTALKLTPALALLWFAWKRSGRAALGWLLGLAAFSVLAPAPWLGLERTLALLGGWWQQMAAPYLAGAPPTLMQTEHINQSLLGVLARLTTDAVAIEARPGVFASDVRVNLLALPHGALRALLLACTAGVLAWLALCWRRREPRGPDGSRDGLRALGELACLALAMLLLSERSWKHHHVLLVLPIAFLAWHLATLPRAARGWSVAALGLLASALLHGLSGSGVLGARGSDLAEACGAFLWGDLALLASCGLLLRMEPSGRGTMLPRWPPRAPASSAPSASGSSPRTPST